MSAQFSADRHRMVEQYLPLADSLARRYGYTSEPIDDLLQVARMGLVKAVDRWDPARGNAFSTFAVPTILGELGRYFRDSTWTVKPSRDVQELFLKVKKAREALSQELRREPTVRDLSRELGRSDEAIVEAYMPVTCTRRCDRSARCSRSATGRCSGCASREDLVQREIAERVGCSQMHVSRILRLSVARLEEAAAA